MVNRIKIDRSFIAGIEASEEQRTLTASMIAMAQALGIGTLAEGVETEAARGGAGAGSAATSSRDTCWRGRCRWPQTLPWLGVSARAGAVRNGHRHGLGTDPNTP